MITIDPENVETIESSFWERIEPGKYTKRQGATAADIETGARWYPDKEPMMRQLSEIGDTTIEALGTVTSMLQRFMTSFMVSRLGVSNTIYTPLTWPLS